MRPAENRDEDEGTDTLETPEVRAEQMRTLWGTAEMILALFLLVVGIAFVTFGQLYAAPLLLFAALLAWHAKAKVGSVTAPRPPSE